VTSRTERARALVRTHGWNPSSSQILSPGYRYWFTKDAVVAYADTGRTLVAAGAPVCPEPQLARVARRFAAAARRRGRSVAFFGVHERFRQRLDWPSLAIGELPYWDSDRWPDLLRTHPSLREQIRRARAKGVTVTLAGDADREALAELRSRWLAGHRLAPMHFLVLPAGTEPDVELLVARRGDEPLGYVSLLPIHARHGLLVQDCVRAPGAPNGTVELLIDAAIRRAASRGLRYTTLGLAPLSGTLPRWLLAARMLGRPLYDFVGLRAFKAKLQPAGWEQVSLTVSDSTALGGLIESLRAFAGGSLAAFGLATARRWLGVHGRC
jgi:phosphatidylglycerol lysyltransferase